MTFDEWKPGNFGELTPDEIAKCAWEAATRAERWECAKVAEDFDFNERPEISPPRTLPRYIAQAIRERSDVEVRGCAS